MSFNASKDRAALWPQLNPTAVALRETYSSRPVIEPNIRVIHHSAQGAQYTALSFSKHLEKAGIAGSMGRVKGALD